MSAEIRDSLKLPQGSGRIEFGSRFGPGLHKMPSAPWQQEGAFWYDLSVGL